jgi:putative transposase
MNRGNRKKRIFHDDGDYWLFASLLAEATSRFSMRLLAYCIMPNHWHLVLWPSTGDDVSAYMRWLTSTHAQQYHHAHNLIGTGHLYQGRYRSVPVQSGHHLLTVLRYVEANPVRAGLVSRAEDWLWSSLADETPGLERFTSASPVPRPSNWLAHVNSPMVEDVEQIRRAVSRGTPYGTSDWARHITDPADSSTGAIADPSDL